MTVPMLGETCTFGEYARSSMNVLRPGMSASTAYVTLFVICTFFV